MNVLRMMYSHSRACVSGDNSLEAARRAVREVTEAEADDYFVFLLSDANLGRYSVTPEQLGEALRADPRVNAFAIFVAEANAAEWLVRELPLGHGFSVLDAAKLPTVMQQVFAHAAANVAPDA